MAMDPRAEGFRPRSASEPSCAVEFIMGINPQPEGFCHRSVSEPSSTADFTTSINPRTEEFHLRLASEPSFPAEFTVGLDPRAEEFRPRSANEPLSTAESKGLAAESQCLIGEHEPPAESLSRRKALYLHGPESAARARGCIADHDQSQIKFLKRIDTYLNNWKVEFGTHEVAAAALDRAATKIAKLRPVLGKPLWITWYNACLNRPFTRGSHRVTACQNIDQREALWDVTTLAATSPEATVATIDTIHEVDEEGTSGSKLDKYNQMGVGKNGENDSDDIGGSTQCDGEMPHSPFNYVLWKYYRLSTIAVRSLPDGSLKGFVVTDQACLEEHLASLGISSELIAGTKNFALSVRDLNVQSCDPLREDRLETLEARVANMAVNLVIQRQGASRTAHGTRVTHGRCGKKRAGNQPNRSPDQSDLDSLETTSKAIFLVL